MSFGAPTQVDVAKRAGVSRSTVSLVINDVKDAGIPAETRRRVLEAVRELGYAPNAAAQSLAKKRSRLIGVFSYESSFPQDQHNFYYQFLQGIQEHVSKEGYDILLFTGRHVAESAQSIYRRDVNVLGMVDGTVIMGSDPDHDEIRQLAKEGRRFVYIGRREIEGCQFDWVTSDYRSGAYAATRALLDVGHRTIGYVSREGGGRTFDQERFQGCRDAIDEVPGAKLVAVSKHLTEKPEYFKAALQQAEVTAVSCASMLVLAKVLQSLQGRMRIPDDLSLVALDDEFVNDLANGHNPACVVLNRVPVGQEAARLLISKIEGCEKGPQHVRVPCAFRFGNTIAKPSRL